MTFLSMDIKTREYLPGLALFSSPWGIVGDYRVRLNPKGPGYRLTVLEQHLNHQPLSCQFALTSDLNRTLIQEENGVLWFEQDEPVNSPQSEVRFDRIWTLQTRTYEIQISAADFLIERIQPTVEKTFRHLIETQTK